MSEFDMSKEENCETGKIIYSDGSTGELKHSFLTDHFRIFTRQEDVVSIIFPPVPTIQSLGFSDCDNLKSIVIPEGVKEIKGWAFAALQSLEEVTLPESLTYIDSLAFNCCTKLPKIVIPKNVSRLEAHTFIFCQSLSDVTLQEGLTYIGDAAFAACDKLTDITIPASVTEIDGNPFGGCRNVKIRLSPENKHFTVIDNNLYSADKKTIISYVPTEGETDIAVPAGVTSIGNSAFSRYENIASISIPAEVKEIGDAAFLLCTSIKSISLPNIPKINNHTFCRCEGLESIAVPATVKEIGKSAFLGCKALRSITLPAGLTAIGDEAFSECESLTDVYFGGSKRKWKKISAGEKNDALKNAKIHFKTLFGYTK